MNPLSTCEMSSFVLPRDRGSKFNKWVTWPCPQPRKGQFIFRWLVLSMVDLLTDFEISRLKYIQATCLDSLPHSLVSSSLSSSPLSSSITHSLSFTPGSKPTFSTNPSHLNSSSTWTTFTITGPDRTYHASRFIFSSFFLYFFLFVPCDGLSWFHVSFLLHVKYTVSYRIGPFGGQNHRQTHICHDPQQYPLADCKRVMSIAHFSGLW